MCNSKNGTSLKGTKIINKILNKKGGEVVKKISAEEKE